ncbi:hypothetical protein LMG29542_07826 [Paraburkholderia humisilvae]|uniref:Uncharacterized protein n=1 Tax=Paraburkholderia humisilvae TaxID=627669 RepID=A0A6J5F6L9_9BURK|nr:hypothetical protein LMG29542_07826 [Paraburkholderia humisilvae]
MSQNDLSFLPLRVMHAGAGAGDRRSFDADLKVFLRREPIDFRAGINSLVMLVEPLPRREVIRQHAP